MPSRLANPSPPQPIIDYGHRLDPGCFHIEDELIGKFAFPCIAKECAHVIGIALFQFFYFFNATPPLGPVF